MRRRRRSRGAEASMTSSTVSQLRSIFSDLFVVVVIVAILQLVTDIGANGVDSSRHDLQVIGGSASFGYRVTTPNSTSSPLADVTLTSFMGNNVVIDDVMTNRSRRFAAAAGPADGSGQLMTSTNGAILPSFPVTFKSPAAFVVAKIRALSTFSIHFQLKTSKLNGVIMFGGRPETDYFVVELVDGVVRYSSQVDGGSQSPVVRTMSLPLPTANRSRIWHEIAVMRVSAQSHVLQVSNSSTTEMQVVELKQPPMHSSRVSRSTVVNITSSLRRAELLRKNTTWDDDDDVEGGSNRTASRDVTSRSRFSRSSAETVNDSPWWLTSMSASGSGPDDLYIGGLPVALLRSISTEIVKSRDGFVGCLASIDINGDGRSLMSRGVKVPDEHREDVIEGCGESASQCTETSCANGGVCIQDWNSVMCDCDMTSFVGPTCNNPGVAYQFSSSLASRGTLSSGSRVPPSSGAIVGGVIVFTFDGSERADSVHDHIGFGMTSSQSDDAILVSITSANSNDYIRIEMTDGTIRAVYNMGTTDHLVSERAARINDNKYHIIRFTRSGANCSLQVDNLLPRTRHPTGRQLTTFNSPSTVVIGGGKDSMGSLLRPFRGSLAGLVYNGQHLLALSSERDSRVEIQGDVRLKVLPTTTSRTTTSSFRQVTRHLVPTVSTNVLNSFKTMTLSDEAAVKTKQPAVTDALIKQPPLFTPAFIELPSKDSNRLVSTDSATDRPPAVYVAADKICSPHDSTCSGHEFVSPSTVIAHQVVVTSSTRHVAIPTQTVNSSSMLSNGAVNSNSASVESPTVGSQSATAGSEVIIGCVITGVCFLAIFGGCAVYRYRKCYDGTYEIDAESSANGYVPTGNGELRPMYRSVNSGSSSGSGHSKMNGSLRTKTGTRGAGKQTTDIHCIRPTRELYV